MLHRHKIKIELELSSLGPLESRLYALQQLDNPFLKLPRWFLIFQCPIQEGKIHKKQLK